MVPLVAEDLIKTYRLGQREVLALQGVTLSVARGRFLAIMGASGSGKSTLLHVMAGLTMPDAGHVYIDGQDITTMGDRPLTLFRRRHIGLVFQAFNLIPTLTARENVALPLLLEGNGAEGNDGKADRVLEMLGLGERREHRPDVLSGGEQQRVAIGRALIMDPAILLADEPTGNLDSASSKGVCELLRDLSQKHGKTIVMVTHEPSVAMYATEVAVVKDGKLVDQFATEDAGGSEGLATRYHACLK